MFEDVAKYKAQVDYWGTMFSAVKNEIYHRRAVEILDSKKELYESGAKEVFRVD